MSEAAIGQRVRDRLEHVSGSTRLSVIPFPADRARDQKCAGFDTIRNDVVFGAVQFLTRLR